MNRRRVPSLEAMIGQFQHQSGLYVTGAGSSAGDVDFGAPLMTDPARQFVLGGSFSATPLKHLALGRRLLADSAGLTLADIYPDREFRSGTQDDLTQEIIQRMPEHYGRGEIKYRLAKARYERRVSANYVALRRFRPGVVANYNHDGLAADICGDVHRVIDMHGSVARAYGSAEMQRWLEEARHYDLPVHEDGLLMCVPEPTDHSALRKRLDLVTRTSPDFIAVIGYSFGLNDRGVDDGVSLDAYARAFRKFPGNIFVIDPHPDRLAHTLEKALKAERVFPMEAYWNILTRALVERRQEEAKSLRYAHEAILDRDGCKNSLLLGHLV